MASNGTAKQDTSDDKTEPDPFAGVPLFAGEKYNDVQYLAVERVSPAIEPEEGYLGRLDVGATQSDLKTRYGGGRYKVTARNASGDIRGSQHVTIAGEPIFTTAAGRKNYKAHLRALAAAGRDDDDDDGNTTRNAQPNIMLEVLQMQIAQQRADAEAREARDREERRERERDREEREERRRREAEDREERRAREAEEARQRDRDHQQSMLQMVMASQQNQGSDVAMLLQGLKLGVTVGGAGDDDDDADDPYGIAGAIKELVTGAVKNKAGGDDDEPGVKLTGDAAAKVAALAQAAKDAGEDPDKVLSGIADWTTKKLAEKKKGKTDEGRKKLAAAVSKKKAASSKPTRKPASKKAGATAAAAGGEKKGKTG